MRNNDSNDSYSIEKGLQNFGCSKKKGLIDIFYAHDMFAIDWIFKSMSNNEQMEAFYIMCPNLIVVTIKFYKNSLNYIKLSSGLSKDRLRQNLYLKKMSRQPSNFSDIGYKVILHHHKNGGHINDI